ncbi:MAG: pilus assembly protein, partial [Lysobacter sp.]
MNSLRQFLAGSLLAVAAGAAYLHYQADAAQAEGGLAQAPLNSVVAVPPAFVMAVDNSGSMTFQTLFPGADGAAFWDYASAASNGYFIGSGANARLRTLNDINYTVDGNGNIVPQNDDMNNFHYVIPSVSYKLGGRYAIAPLDNFGFARSSEYNPAYYNPDTVYPVWKEPDASNAIVNYPNADTTNTQVEPGSIANTINLFSVWRQNATDQLFQLPRGTRLPSDTVYYSPSRCGGLTTGSWTTVPKGPQGQIISQEVTASCAVGIGYWPATYYMKSKLAGKASGYTVDPEQATNACGSGCHLWRYRIAPGNYATTADFDRARQNFANWFSFYGNRNRAMKAALTIAFENTEQMRVGMFTINTIPYNAARADPQPYSDVIMRDMSSATDKTRLYDDNILQLTSIGGTPNRFAVDQIGKQFERRVTANDRNPPIKHACQINAGMLFTDGYSNLGGPDVIDFSDASMPLPLRDAHPNTLADIAAKYYLKNLSNLPLGQVPVPKEDCAANPNNPKIDCRTDPHMNFYAVTLGATGNIYGNTYNPDTNQPDPFTTTPGWQARTDNSPATVDELWHATLNARGRFINARTPADITSAMKSIIGSLGSGSMPASGTGLTGSRIGTNTLSVVPEYAIENNSTDWYGKLKASRLDASGQFVQIWEASAGLGAGRTIKYGKSVSASLAPTVSDFAASNIGNDLSAALCNDALQNCAGKFGKIAGGVTVDQAVAYLRGAKTHEGGKLRKRTTLLGDIVNSSPLVSGATDDYGYTALDGDRLHYATYLNAKRTGGRKPFVYVGANDGMFHAFDGTDGREAFAYIPTTSLGHMGNLLFPYKPDDKLDQVFKHRYYVDGQITVQDAYLTDAWKTVLVASVGAGGRGVFALDVTDQSTLSVLWELNDRASAANGGNDIGSVMGEAAIVPVRDGAGNVAWKAIFGNGYGSVDGRAVLFVVDMATRAVTRIRAEETGADRPTRTGNGLGNIVVVDRYTGATGVAAQDGFADTVYGGDLNGAVWKFDLRSNEVALGGKPLFVARNNDDFSKRQPITGGFEATSAGE